MNDTTIIGVDLAKNIFQVHAENSEGKKLFNKKLSRGKFKEFLRNQKNCLIGMEACGTAHYWARHCLELGLQVKLINPRKVKAFLDGNKNDEKDAEAICDATKSQKVRGIPVKTKAQQDLTSLHRARSSVIGRRTQIGNHLRSLLAEYGLVTRGGHAALMELTRNVLGGELMDLSQELLFVIYDLYEELNKLKKRVLEYDDQLKRVAKENKTVQRLMEMPGVGEVSATALVAKVEDFKVFKRGRNFSAWLGLTPKEYSSAGTRHMGGISKKGDRYLRTLLIHGARAVVRAVVDKKKMTTAYHRWIQMMVLRCGKNKAAVALANKHARMIWAIMVYDRKLDLDFSESFRKKVA